MTRVSEEFFSFISDHLRVEGIDPSLLQWEKLGGDGSRRDFYRLRYGERSWVLLIEPHPPRDEKGVSENDSYLYVARHLRGKGFPVPEIYGADHERGLFLVEDLGDHHLQDEVLSRGRGDPKVGKIYQEVIDLLLRLQIEGARGFDLARTHNPPYDREFALRWESGYFRRGFVEGFLGLKVKEETRRELELAAAQVARAPGGFFLYRDFQSRNIMLKKGKLHLIDFQGARLGPLAYDLASLLIDPYVELPEALKEELFNYYLERLRESLPEQKEPFLRSYPYIALHRNMQILGAFGTLVKRGKNRFAPYIRPALRNMIRLLDEDPLKEFRSLRALVEEANEITETFPTSPRR